jgi:hypothetical protein
MRLSDLQLQIETVDFNILQYRGSELISDRNRNC